VNALVCADHVLAPVSTEDEASLHGIVELRQTIGGLGERLGVRAPALIAIGADRSGPPLGGFRSP
jgi:cellulose biosynthesis protein BcsQ